MGELKEIESNNCVLLYCLCPFDS